MEGNSYRMTSVCLSACAGPNAKELFPFLEIACVDINNGITIT